MHSSAATVDRLTESPAARTGATGESGGVSRDPALRVRYAQTALAYLPRLLGAIDRNPYRPTYGCFDREFWHYRTSSFASEMYQEAVLPLALVYCHPLLGNRWFGEPRVRELAIAGLRFSARSCHADGSCDDYYPFERALGAAVFSLQAAARAYQLLELDCPTVRAWLERRARWIIRHDESGQLANHQALAALGLWRVGQITARTEYRRAAHDRLRKVLAWQSDEGWFQEYGGADAGYQTVTIDCLAKLCRLTNDGALDEPLRRAVAFCRLMLHPDDSYGGEYSSRGTYHFYPHGFELLAAVNHQAAELADGFLRSLASGKQAHFDDDRMYVHRLASLIEAYLDWSPAHPTPASERTDGMSWLPAAGLLVCRHGVTHTVVSTSRGGTFKHFAPGRAPVTDSGLILEASDGRVAVSQRHDPTRQVRLQTDGVDQPAAHSGNQTSKTFGLQPSAVVSVSGPLHWVRFETLSPWKVALFHLGMWAVGRWCRTWARRLLQQRLITGRRECPVRLSRTFEFSIDEPASHTCRVTDCVEAGGTRFEVRNMNFATDMESAYVAASNVYQESMLQSWTDLMPHVAELNGYRRTTIVRKI